MDKTLPLVGAFLDPLVKSQFAQIAQYVPSWNIDAAKTKVIELADKYKTVTVSTPGPRQVDFPIELEDSLEK
uniref:Uncharacterized protein n=1 Tax=Ditylenchus dipsaci TaxID=166011 RepID=A0A915CTF5_9BILA